MAFPTVAGTTSSVQSSDTTTHTVSLPGSIAAGELLVVAWGSGGLNPGAALTWPGGWTVKSSTTSSNVGGRWAYRIADGSEGASISVTSGSVTKSAHRSWRIQGHDTTTNALQDQGFWNVGTDAAPNPPGHTPTGGAKDYLWLEFAAADSGLLCSAASASFTNLETAQSGVNVNADAGLSTARRELNASSTDPAAMTLSGAEGWVAITTAIHPGSEGIPSPGGGDVLDPMGMRGFFGA